MASMSGIARLGPGGLVLLPDSLSVYQERAFRFIEACANLDLYCSAGELEDAMGSPNSSGSTQARVCLQLEAMGLIRRHYFQRGRWFEITATGRRTMRPRCEAPHWRDRAIQRPGKAA